MTASEVLTNLQERGVDVSVESGQVKMGAPQGVLTPADLEAVASVKKDIIRILTAPAHGSINWPMAVHTRRLNLCPWDKCRGAVVARRNLYMCGKCGWWFQTVVMEGRYL